MRNALSSSSHSHQLGNLWFLLFLLIRRYSPMPNSLIKKHIMQDADYKNYQHALLVLSQIMENTFMSPEIRYSLRASIKAIKKQISQTAIVATHKTLCPACHNIVTHKYCDNCGQKIKYAVSQDNT